MALATGGGLWLHGGNSSRPSRRSWRSAGGPSAREAAGIWERRMWSRVSGEAGAARAILAPSRLGGNSISDYLCRLSITRTYVELGGPPSWADVAETTTHPSLANWFNCVSMPEPTFS